MGESPDFRNRMMNWAVAGLVYVALYSAILVVIGTREPARVIVGNIGLLLPPLAPLAVLIMNMLGVTDSGKDVDGPRDHEPENRE